MDGKNLFTKANNSRSNSNSNDNLNKYDYSDKNIIVDTLNKASADNSNSASINANATDEFESAANNDGDDAEYASDDDVRILDVGLNETAGNVKKKDTNWKTSMVVAEQAVYGH